MTRSGRAAAVVACGAACVGTLTGCVLWAIPDRPIAREWPPYAALLLAPYVVCGLACWRSPDRIAVRAGGWATCVGGVVLAVVAVADVWPTFSGGPPPGVPAAVMVSIPVVLVQSSAALLAGLVATRGPRTAAPAPSSR